MRQLERRARTRETLLHWAMAGFARNGYDDASLDAIAASAGLSKGAIYAHFETKLDLYLAVLADAFAEARMRNARVLVALAERRAPAAAAQAYFASPGLREHIAFVTGLWHLATREAAAGAALEEFRTQRLAEFAGAAVSLGMRPAPAIELALTVGKLIDAEMLAGRLHDAAVQRAG